MMQEQWIPNKPYNSIGLLPPNIDLETKAVLKQCISARTALAQLKQAAKLIPNQSMLINTLPLMEARASSEIENIVTTNDNMFKYLNQIDKEADSATKEALRYRTALLNGFNSIKTRPITTKTAEEICTDIKRVNMQVRKTVGTALKNNATGEIIYTPPEGEAHLRNLLSNWEKFIHNEVEIDPLIRMAVAHYQFEAIHPFIDGNGRTGRILNSLFLIQEQLLELPILYLSRFIIKNKLEYYRLLLEVTQKQAWEPWLQFILRGVEETAIWTVAKIEAISRLLENTVVFVRKKAEKIYSRELVELLFEQPYCRISSVTSAGIAKRETASIYLKQLVEIGVLANIENGKVKLFTNPKLLTLLGNENHAFEPYSIT